MFGGALIAAPAANADWALTGGNIGVVDLKPNSTYGPDNQGATLLYPGVDGQKMGDIRLVIPNEFANGDVIDLAIFDRTATATSAGQINADTAHRLGFTAAPTVNVNATPYVAATDVAADTDQGANNTEEPTGLVAVPAGPTRPTTPPAFTAELVQSSRANGLANDIIRLRVNGVQDNGDNTAKWIVTLSGVTVNVGTAVSPGALRVVPFAYNGAPQNTFANKSPLFAGNLPDTDNNPATFDPTIGVYTVPSFVSPVNFEVGLPNNVVADGTPQKVGDIKITETNNYSLQNGTYYVHVNSATIQNTATSPVTVTLTNGDTVGGNETVTSPATVVDSDTLAFTLAGENDDAGTKSTITLSNLLLSDNAQGPITYRMTGGSVDGDTNGDGVSDGNAAFLVTAGSGAAIGGAAPNGVPAESAFSANVNQDDILAPRLTVSSVSTPLEARIGGSDRYETAAKIAQNMSNASRYAILASGENFPDALSSNYMSAAFNAPILLTRKNNVPQVTKAALRQLGTNTVFVIGGPAAVSQGVASDIDDDTAYFPGGNLTVGNDTIDVVRIAGDNRYETNREANEYAAANWDGPSPVGRTQPTFGQPSKLTALVATGEDFADALSAGPATWGVQDTFGPVQGGLPLILTRSGSLSPEAGSQMSAFGIDHAVIVGGTSAVSDAVETAIKGTGASTARLAGTNRYDTATKVATWVTTPSAATATTGGGLGFDDTAVEDEWAYLATGQKFADALAGGPLAGANASPIVLTPSTTLAPETKAWLTAKAAQYSQITALGLGAAVASSVLDAANAAISAS
jgi:putative cell wall-binding protein